MTFKGSIFLLPHFQIGNSVYLFDGKLILMFVQVTSSVVFEGSGSVSLRVLCCGQFCTHCIYRTYLLWQYEVALCSAQQPSCSTKGNKIGQRIIWRQSVALRNRSKKNEIGSSLSIPLYCHPAFYEPIALWLIDQCCEIVSMFLFFFGTHP